MEVEDQSNLRLFQITYQPYSAQIAAPIADRFHVQNFLTEGKVRLCPEMISVEMQMMLLIQTLMIIENPQNWIKGEKEPYYKDKNFGTFIIHSVPCGLPAEYEEKL